MILAVFRKSGNKNEHPESNPTADWGDFGTDFQFPELRKPVLFARLLSQDYLQIAYPQEIAQRKGDV